MVTQDERNRTTRSALIEAGRALFAERGYAEVSVAEIAERADVTTGALYHQFASKQGLFTAVYAELVHGVWAKVLTARETSDQPSLLVDCEAYIDACADPAFNRITIDGPAVIGWDQILDEAQSMIEASLTAAQARREIAAAPIESLSRMLAAALKEAAVMIARAEDPVAARAAARDSARHLVGGMLGPSGTGTSGGRTGSGTHASGGTGTGTG
jgi:AcrR family transcriptional regulator